MNRYDLRKRNRDKKEESTEEEWLPEKSSSNSSDDSTDDNNERPKKVRKKSSEGHIMAGLKQKFIKEFPDLDESEIEEIIEDAFDERGNIKTPYYQEIEKFFPTQERQRMRTLCNTLYFQEKGSVGYINAIYQINNILERRNYNISDKDERTLGLLRATIQKRKISIENILHAYLTNDEKIRALEVYDRLLDPDLKAEDIISIQNRLDVIMSAQLSSEEEVKNVEKDEKNARQNSFISPASIRRKIFALDADAATKSVLYNMYYEMIARNSKEGRYGDVMDKLTWAVKLPHRKITLFPGHTKDLCKKVFSSLNKEIYGLAEVKEAVVRAVNDRFHNPSSRSIIALQGVPGVGKTKIAKVIADSIGIPFNKISLGGAIDPTIFKGSDNVWSGASPSMILKTLAKSDTSDCMILLDEVDKLTTSDRGIVVQHSLLHVLDPTQSLSFHDEFLCEYPHDISRIWFVVSMNDDAYLDPALKDRLNIINIPSYTPKEKVEIIKKHVLPEALLDKGLDLGSVTIKDEAAKKIALMFPDEGGIRSVEKVINKIVSKINLCGIFQGENIETTDSNACIKTAIPGFSGFPYTITEECIKKLAPKKPEVFLGYVI